MTKRSAGAANHSKKLIPIERRPSELIEYHGGYGYIDLKFDVDDAAAQKGLLAPSIKLYYQRVLQGDHCIGIADVAEAPEGLREIARSMMMAADDLENARGRLGRLGASTLRARR